MHDVDQNLKGMKVLLVDDTPANIDVLKLTLGEQGLNISIAPSGEVALKVAAHSVPDLILLDIMMPGIDGFETCRRLKENDAMKAIPVIFISAKVEREDIEKIFEPFYTKKKMGRSGTGLGLAVVWGVVKDLNGYIDVKSADGKGTTFTLFFPVSREDSVPAEAKLSLDSLMGNGESVLVVDDVQEQRQIASGMLEILGYTTASVPSGEEAIEYVKNNRVDLLVLDMMMDPGIDGLDTYRKIIELRFDQKAIIASGFSDTDRVKEAQKLGAGSYVKKPYTIEKIGIAVKSELEKTV